MFGKKEVDSGKVGQAVRNAVSYEITVADMARRSERRAWWVAISSLILSLLLAGGYYFMLPLKEKVPFLVMADAYTGTATVAHLVGNFQNQDITVNEAINRSNVAQYVMARESYDYAITGLRDWRQVFVMSTPQAVSDYRQLFANGSANDPRRVYGKNRAIRVKILSLAPMKTGPNGSFRAAAVRIQRDIFDKTSGTSQFLDNKYITLEFTYLKSMKLDEQDRIINPLGFQVTGYRVDNDYGKAVPVVDPAAPPETTAPAAPAAPAAPLEPASGGMPGMGEMPALDSDAADLAPAIGTSVSPSTGTQEVSPPISIGNADGASNR
jgi:type IV secretion system protein VirB8